MHQVQKQPKKKLVLGSNGHCGQKHAYEHIWLNLQLCYAHIIIIRCKVTKEYLPFETAQSQIKYALLKFPI